MIYLLAFLIVLYLSFLAEHLQNHCSFQACAKAWLIFPLETASCSWESGFFVHIEPKLAGEPLSGLWGPPRRDSEPALSPVLRASALGVGGPHVCRLECVLFRACSHRVCTRFCAR